MLTNITKYSNEGNEQIAISVSINNEVKLTT